MLCNVASTSDTEGESTSYTPGELKRRSKARLSIDARNMSNSTIEDNTKTASSIVSGISSGIAASTASVAATTAPSAGAGLSSAVVSGTVVAQIYNLTRYVTQPTALPSMTTTVALGCANGRNGSHGNATYTSPKVTTTATFTGVKSGNGTVVLAHGGASSVRAEGLMSIVGGLALAMGIMLVL